MTLTQGWDRVARLRACGGCRYRTRIERAGRNCVGPREALLRQRRLDVDLPISNGRYARGRTDSSRPDREVDHYAIVAPFLR